MSGRTARTAHIVELKKAIDAKGFSASGELVARRSLARLLAADEDERETPLRNLGDLVRAAARVAATGQPNRILKRAPTGAGGTSPAIGGFLVGSAMAEPIFETIFSRRNSPLSYFRKFKFPQGKNELAVPGVDETSRANGYRWGGLVVDFIDEGILQTTSFPKFKETDFAAEKILALVPLTNELLSDAENLTQYLNDAIADEIAFKLEQYALTSAGTGAGRPLSVVSGPALIKVAAQTGQKAKTVVYENLLSMWNALPSASRKTAIWVGAESVAQQIFTNEALAQLQASYPQSGSANPDDTPRLFGRPFIESDALPLVGTVGDLLLIDPKWYGVCTKPMASALSADVAFLNDQAYLRVVLRCDANPLVSSPLTASDGTQRSAFVALAAR